MEGIILLMRYGADIIIPKNTNIGQLAPLGATSATEPATACSQAWPLKSEALLNPSVSNIFLYNQFMNLNKANDCHMCPNIERNLPKFSAIPSTALNELVIAKNVESIIIDMLLNARTTDSIL